MNFRYALRQLRKSPGFAVTAILTLAIGIGANVAVFSVTNAVLLNPAGLPHADRVVALRAHYGMAPELANISMSAPDFHDAVSGDQFSAAAVMQPGSVNYLPEGGTPERLITARVSWRFFDVFDSKPILGRSFREEEDRPEANHEVILAYATWKKRFGGDASIVGRKLEFDQQPYEVVGVMGPEFAWPNQAQAWTPLAFPPGRFTDENYRYNENLFAVGRMKAGVTSKDVNSYLSVKSKQDVDAEGAQGFGKRSKWGMFAVPMIEFTTGDLRKPLSILLTAVALVLLIACANIAGLQLARASDRQREMSIRIALGAGRARLLQQALAESCLIAAGGVFIGLAIAASSMPALLAVAPQSLSRNISVHLSGTVLAYLALAAVVCAVLCGIAPAYHATAGRWFGALQEGGRSETGSKMRQQLRSAMVVAEIAIAMLLLVSAGLLVRSLKQVERVQTGFDPANVATASLMLPRQAYSTPEKQAAFASALENELKAIPGVTAAALADAVPFSGDGGSASFSVVGRVLAPNDPGPHGNIRQISDDYFRTLSIPLVRGRLFESTDRSDTQPVVIIDETLAKQYWPNEDPLGKQLNYDKARTIVGIVPHAKSAALDADNNEGFYYLPLTQSPSSGLSILLKTTGDPRQFTNSMRDAVGRVDPGQAIYDIKTMEERVDASLVSRRFLVILLSTFAAIALLLAALGLYGVISYGVHMRTRELGIRMALGAQRADLLKLVLRHGVALSAVGIVSGVLVTFISGRVLSSLLFNTSLFNPVALAGTAALLIATVLLASYLPARRAAALDPMITLREE